MGAKARATAGLAAALIMGAPSAAHANPLCGEIVMTSVTLDADMACPVGDGILVGADDITIDLNGHTILGGSAAGKGREGVRADAHRGVTIKGGTIQSFTTGIRLDRIDSTKVTGITLRENLTGLTATRASNLVINQNFAVDSTAMGIDVSGTRGIHVDHNRVMSTKTGPGLSVTGEGAMVADNAATNNGGDGIVIGADATRTTMVIRNVASFGRADGIRVAGPGSTVSANTTNGNSRYGIEAVEGTIDGGDNVAAANAGSIPGAPQCLVVVCLPSRNTPTGPPAAPSAPAAPGPIAPVVPAQTAVPTGQPLRKPPLYRPISRAVALRRASRLLAHYRSWKLGRKRTLTGRARTDASWLCVARWTAAGRQHTRRVRVFTRDGRTFTVRFVAAPRRR